MQINLPCIYAAMLILLLPFGGGHAAASNWMSGESNGFGCYIEALHRGTNVIKGMKLSDDASPMEQLRLQMKRNRGKTIITVTKNALGAWRGGRSGEEPMFQNDNLITETCLSQTITSDVEVQAPAGESNKSLSWVNPDGDNQNIGVRQFTVVFQKKEDRQQVWQIFNQAIDAMPFTGAIDRPEIKEESDDSDVESESLGVDDVQGEGMPQNTATGDMLTVVFFVVIVSAAMIVGVIASSFKGHNRSRKETNH